MGDKEGLGLVNVARVFVTHPVFHCESHICVNFVRREIRNQKVELKNGHFSFPNSTPASRRELPQSRNNQIVLGDFSLVRIKVLVLDWSETQEKNWLKHTKICRFQPDFPMLCRRETR